jgi:hypothetical protein
MPAQINSGNSSLRTNEANLFVSTDNTTILPISATDELRDAIKLIGQSSS